MFTGAGACGEGALAPTEELLNDDLIRGDGPGGQHVRMIVFSGLVTAVLIV